MRSHLAPATSHVRPGLQHGLGWEGHGVERQGLVKSWP